MPHANGPACQHRAGAARLVRDAICLFASGLAVAGALAGYFLYLVGGTLFAHPVAGTPHTPVEPAPANTYPDIPAQWQGIRLPPARAADDAQLRDEAEVIGVCAGGRARAYWVAALSGGPQWHVVNDVLGGQAVSVTYCEGTRCSRTFTGEPAAAPLPLGVAGWINKGLALRVGDADYSQATGECLSDPGAGGIPYAEMAHERTTWEAWRQAHPDTDVYVGDPPHEQAAPGPAGD